MKFITIPDSILPSVDKNTDSSSSSGTSDVNIITRFLKTAASIVTGGISDKMHDLVSNVKDSVSSIIPDTDHSSGSSGTIIDDLKSYFDGLLTNQGQENEINRQYNSAEALKNREFQASESQLQRDWYEYMSNTAYTRAVADMKAAGLNPILAYSNGGAASSGTGIGAGSAASYNSTGGDTLSSLLSAASDVIDSVAYSSASKVNKAFKIIKMLGG